MLASDRSAAQSADFTREFLDGNRGSFSTKGHPKAKGVNFTIAYPSSWAAAEGDRPNVVQKFVSNGGRGLESAVIITKDLPLSAGTVLTKQDLRDLFTLEELREGVPDGALFVVAKSTEIEGVPAGILEYVTHGERTGVELVIQTWALNFISGTILVQVQFGVAGSTESEIEVFRRMAAFKPLFVLMANSIVLPDEWPSGAETRPNATMPASPTSVLPYDSHQLSTLNAVASLVITWGLGITPPLVIRYALLRRPLSKKAASWLAAGFSAFFWIAFLSLNHALDRSLALDSCGSSCSLWLDGYCLAGWLRLRRLQVRKISTFLEGQADCGPRHGRRRPSAGLPAQPNEPSAAFDASSFAHEPNEPTITEPVPPPDAEFRVDPQRTRVTLQL